MATGTRFGPLPSTNEVALKPWKYIGWRGFARFAASDDDFLVLRRFDVSTVRILLSMQDGIVRLEEELSKGDDECSRVNAPDINNGTFRDDPRDDRRRLIADLKTALVEYSTRFEFWLDKTSKGHANTLSRTYAVVTFRVEVAPRCLPTKPAQC